MFCGEPQELILSLSNGPDGGVRGQGVSQLLLTLL